MIRTEEISFHIGTFQLRNVSCEVATGQYFVLLGPPGSGKTIFLECLCGLKKIESGRIFIDGRDVTGFEPRARSIGYVPQDYALFPHLSVELNIAFGLRVKGFPRQEREAKVAEAAELLEIRHLLQRGVSGLSGGEKQRVALARALVLQPKVLLLDEPVCALDEVTRQGILTQLFRIQRKLNLTTIHVSHNLEEAFSVADRAAILRQGLLQQVGTLSELLRKPNNEFVARFMRCENIFCAEAVANRKSQIANRKSGDTVISVGDIRLQILGQHSGRLKFMIRPEDVLILPGPGDRDWSSVTRDPCDERRVTRDVNAVRAKLERWRNCGGYVRVELAGPLNLVAHTSHATFAELQRKSQGDVVAVLHPENIHVLPGFSIVD